jgi:hypothetical protein
MWFSLLWNEPSHPRREAICVYLSIKIAEVQPMACLSNHFDKCKGSLIQLRLVSMGVDVVNIAAAELC